MFEDPNYFEASSRTPDNFGYDSTQNFGYDSTQYFLSSTEFIGLGVY